MVEHQRCRDGGVEARSARAPAGQSPLGGRPRDGEELRRIRRPVERGLPFARGVLLAPPRQVGRRAAVGAALRAARGNPGTGRARRARGRRVCLPAHGARRPSSAVPARPGAEGRHGGAQPGRGVHARGAAGAPLGENASGGGVGDGEDEGGCDGGEAPQLGARGCRAAAAAAAPRRSRVRAGRLQEACGFVEGASRRAVQGRGRIAVQLLGPVALGAPLAHRDPASALLAAGRAPDGRRRRRRCLRPRRGAQDTARPARDLRAVEEAILRSHRRSRGRPGRPGRRRRHPGELPRGRTRGGPAAGQAGKRGAEHPHRELAGRAAREKRGGRQPAAGQQRAPGRGAGSPAAARAGAQQLEAAGHGPRGLAREARERGQRGRLGPKAPRRRGGGPRQGRGGGQVGAPAVPAAAGGCNHHGS
mmetsp:Transcript_44580/g.129639  ORF Transcript_44580/g.129639 Transcript_44580/m.129639 type:complete len:419 (+) Transcript_44580:2746-4002(+)